MKWEEQIMKSKKSYFNPTIFKKNIASYWPVWGSFLAIIVMLMPIHIGLLFTMADYRETEQLRRAAMIEAVYDCLHPGFMISLCTVWSLLSAIVVFQYLNHARNAYMMHAFPVTRKELLITNVLSGLTMMIGPELIVFIASVLLCAGYHVPVMLPLLQWFISAVIISVFLFSLATFCVFMAGNSIAVVFYYLFFNIAYEIIYYVLSLFRMVFAYGLPLSSFDFSAQKPMDFLSPIVFMWQKLSARAVYSAGDLEYTMSSIQYEGLGYIIGFLLIALCFFVLSWFMYKKRKIEYAGDMVAIPFMRPVMRWTIGIGFGATSAITLFIVLLEVDICLNYPTIFAIFMVGGMLAFCITQMLIARSFRIFKKRLCVEMLGFAGALVLAFLGARGMAGIQERYIPSVDNIEQATCLLDYTLCYDNEDEGLQFVVDLQKYILDHKSVLQDRVAENISAYSDGYYVNLEYRLKNGNKISRLYSLNMQSQEAAYVIEMIRTEESKTENLMQNGLGMKTLSRSNLTGAVFQDYLEDEGETVGFRGENDEFAKQLYDAVIRDYEEGNMQPYIYWGFQLDGNVPMLNTYADSIEFNFLIPKPQYEKIKESIWELQVDYDYEFGLQADGSCIATKNVIFGPRCTNIINCLEMYGFIRDENDLTISDDIGQ